MLYYKEFKSSLKSILSNRSKRNDYLFMFVQLVIFSNMLEITTENYFLYINLILCTTLVINKHKTLSETNFAIIIFYSLLCIIPIIDYGITELNAYIGYAIRLLTAGLIANYFGRKFPEVFENIVFLLAYLSIPLFIIQLINPHFYDFLTPLSRAIMAGRQYYVGERGISMHQYSFIYVMNGWALNRNSGFMWEPAAFGAVLIWASIFNLFFNKFKLNKKLLVFIIVGFTTFSVGLYLYFIIFFLAFIIQNGLNLKKIGVFVLAVSVILILFTQTSLFENQYGIMSAKYNEQSNIGQVTNHSSVFGEINRVNRVQSYFLNLNTFFKSPFGYGMNNEKIIFASGNGLMDLATKWGVGGISVLIFCFYKVAKILRMFYFPSINQISFLLIILLFILPLSGNPFYNAIFVFAIMFFPFYIPRNILIRKDGF